MCRLLNFINIIPKSHPQHSVIIDAKYTQLLTCEKEMEVSRFVFTLSLH
jgi:hypothetical protein